MSIKVHETSMDYELLNGVPTIYVSKDVLNELEIIKERHNSKHSAFNIMYDSDFAALRVWIYDNDYAEMNTREEHFLSYLDGWTDFKVRS